MQNRILFKLMLLMFCYVVYEGFYEQMIENNPKVREMTRKGIDLQCKNITVNLYYIIFILFFVFAYTHTRVLPLI